MGTDDRLDAAAQRAEGKAKAAAGKLTDDDKLEREGRMDQAKGAVKEAVEDVKEAAHKVTDRIKDAKDR